VSNNTLAQLSSSYNFPDCIVAAPSALYTTRLQVKTRASVFEAYIAAVFYDFLASEVPGAYAIVSETTTIDPQSELDEIESRTAGSDIGSAPSRGVSTSVRSRWQQAAQSPAQSPAQHPIEEEGFPNHMTTPVPDTAEPTYAPFMATVSLLPPLLPLPTRTRGQAYDYVERWLRPLFAPAAQIAIEIVRQEAGKVAINVNGSEYISGATGCLNSWAAKNTGTMPTYDAQRDGVRWRVECHVVLEDGTVHTASAVRDTKKAATSYAAYVLCKELSLDIGEK
jgi:dsRNA-specific ribonuclease